MSVEHDRPAWGRSPVSDRSPARSMPARRHRPRWSWLDRPVIDVDGLPIGVVIAVFGNDADGVGGSPAWLAIDAGSLDALDVVVASTAGARLVGPDVMVASRRDRVLATRRDVIAAIAPTVEPIAGPTPAAGHGWRRSGACSR